MRPEGSSCTKNTTITGGCSYSFVYSRWWMWFIYIYINVWQPTWLPSSLKHAWFPRNPIPNNLRHFYTCFPSYVGVGNKTPLQKCTAYSRTTEIYVTLHNEVDATNHTWGDRTGAVWCRAVAFKLAVDYFQCLDKHFKQNLIIRSPRIKHSNMR